MKINEIESFPKALLKKKSLPLYKAFIIHTPEDEMKININIDVLSITEEAAIRALVNTLPLEEANDIKGKTISFCILKLDKDDLLTKDIVDEGDIYFEKDMLAITLKDKIYKVDVKDYIISDITIEIDPKTEYRICSNIKLIEA